MRVIDIHAHVTPQRFISAIRGGERWHTLGPDMGELENPRNSMGPEGRLSEMDELGVSVQAVSSTDCFYQYGNAVETTVAIARDANEELAEMHRSYPERFIGLGALPMQNVTAAIEELERVMGELGLKGVMVDDHVNGVTYDDQRFLPFWEAVEGLGAVVFFHQGAPTVVTGLTDRWFLPNTIGNLANRTITFGSLVFGGVMDLFPGLKLCLGHAGGYTAFAVDRMDKGWEAARLDYMSDMPRKHLTRPPSEYLPAFYYDTVTYRESTLRFLIDRVGIDRVVFGTDYPAPMVVNDAVSWILRMETIGDDEKQAMLSDNPARLLGI